jgi:Glu-tRNA(Gln) amidotransferase subunit E-like FAD-binding protein
VELLNSQSFRDVRDFTTELIPRLDKADMTQMYKLISELDTYKESINTVLEIMLLTYRDALVLLSGGDRFVMQRDKVGAIEEITKKGAARLIKSCAVVENAMADLRGNADYQLTMEKMFFDLKM